MNPEITKIIDQYLQGELSETDRAAFEKKLGESDLLRKEFELQQRVYEAAKRASTRTLVKQAGKSFHFMRKVQFTGMAIAIVASISALTFFIAKYVREKENPFTEELVSLMKKLEKESPIEMLKSEFFLWNGSDSVMLSDQGVLLSVPENAFLLDGKPYSEKALIQWQEAMDGATIIKSGLSTMSGDRLLETQGMFGIQAFTPDGKRLTVNPKTGIYVQVPVDEYKTGMQLFEGKTNSEGVIDWQNPKPLLKIPVPVDMSQLDFYPVHYEDALDHLKLRKDKKFRDSLYLSFDEEEIGTERDPVDSIPTPDFKSHVFNEKDRFIHDRLHWQSSVEYITGDELLLTFVAKMDAGVKIKKENQVSPAAFSFDSGEEYNLVGKSEFSLNESRNKLTYKQRIKIDPAYKIGVSVFYSMSVETPEFASWASGYYHIPVNIGKPEKRSYEYISPAKVMAFWNPKFNNTNLSTREFEKRMRSIHATCNEKVLAMYINNLSQPISELDAKVAKMGYRDFEAFAAEQVGALNPDNPHAENLKRFYEKAIQQMRDEVKGNRAALRKKQAQWDAEIRKSRLQESNRTAQRENQALQEEYELNMKNVHKQLGKTVGFQIHGGGTIYNIDKYVMDATVARTSATIIDPETGKTAEIVYNDFSFEVENAGDYQQIYAYLFPSKLSSYQRISGENGKFKYPLNNDMIYDIAIVGISENGYSYFQQKTITKGNLGKINLKNVSETELNAAVEQLNNSRLDKPMPIKDELDWLVKEQKNYKEQKLREKKRRFRKYISSAIFPCYQESELDQSEKAMSSDEFINL